MKTTKRILAFVLVLIMALSFENIAFAEERLDTISGTHKVVRTSGGITPNSDTDHYYQLRNKTYISTNKSILSYLTNVWAKTTHYSRTKSVTKSSTLSVSAASGDFPEGVIKNISTGFNLSVSETFAVGTYPEADSTRYSKLTIQEEKEKYSADLYYVIDYGHTQSSSYQRSGYIYNPINLYLVVVYQ